MSDEVVDFPVNAFQRFFARFRIETGVDFEGPRFVKQGDITADLIAQPAVFPQFEKEPRTGRFPQHRAQQAQGMAHRRVAAGRVPGEGELELIGFPTVLHRAVRGAVAEKW